MLVNTLKVYLTALPSVLLAILIWLIGPSLSPADAADKTVELELVLSADSSSSIKGSEFDLQVKGYANAFRDPGVIDAIINLGGNGIAVTFVQWSASFQQIDTVPWMHIRTRADAEGFAAAIEKQARKFIGFSTATGAAMEHAAELLESNGYRGLRRVIDISSDEHSNEGAHPRHKRIAIIASGITINGLVVLDDDDELEKYFWANVIGGEDAFVMAVESYKDFAKAIKLKLIREITTEPVAELAPQHIFPSPSPNFPSPSPQRKLGPSTTAEAIYKRRSGFRLSTE